MMAIRLFFLTILLMIFTESAVARDLPKCNLIMIKWDFGVAEGNYPNASAYSVDQDNFPRGLAVDDKGYIYVGDGVHYELLKFSPTGKLVWKTSLQPSTQARPKLGYEISAVALGPNSEILVWNRTNERIEVYTPEGKFNRSFPVSLRVSHQPSLDWLYVSKNGEVVACHGTEIECLGRDRTTGTDIKSFSLDGKFHDHSSPDSISRIDFIGKNQFNLNRVYDTEAGRCITIQQNGKDLYSCVGVPINRALHHRFDSDGNLYFLLDDAIAIIRPDYANPILFKDLPNYRRDRKKKLDLTNMTMEKLIGLVFEMKSRSLEEEDPELRQYLLKQKPKDLRLLRNAIYARSLYKFKDKTIEKYFRDRFPDYQPKFDEVVLTAWQRWDVNYLREIEEIVLGKGIDEAYWGAKKRPERHGASKREVIDLTNARGETWFRVADLRLALYFPPKYAELMTGVKRLKIVYSPHSGYALFYTDNKGKDNKQGTNLWVRGLNRNTGFEFHTNKYAGQDLELDWIDELSFSVKYVDATDKRTKTDIYRRQNDKWYRPSEWKLQDK